MVRIDAALVQKVAGLASLDLTESEAAYAQTHLAKILDYAAELGQLPAAALAGAEEVHGEGQGGERSDQVRPSLSAEAVVANAPACAGTAFQVPRIIE